MWLGGALMGVAMAQGEGSASLERLENAVRSGGVVEVQAALEAGAGEGESEDARFWRAQGFFLMGRAEEAAGLFAGLASNRQSRWFQESVLSHGAVWARRGATTRAVRALEAGLESDDPEFLGGLRLRLAELHLAQGGAVEARALLRALPVSLERSALEARAAWMLGALDEAGQLAGRVAAQAPSGAARDTSRLVQARIKASGGQILEADRALLEWVRAEPATAPLPSVVLALEEFNGLAAEEVNTLLKEWGVDPSSPLAAAAAFGQAAGLAGRGEAAAAAAFHTFSESHPDHPLAHPARARAVAMALAASDTGQARTWAESWRARPELERAPAEQAQAHFFAGVASWADGSPAAAVSAFEAAARLAPDGAVEKSARLNAALASLEAGGEVSMDGLAAWPEASVSWYFEAGLFGARHRHPRAAHWLETFLAALQESDPRAAAAWCALAEMNLSLPSPAITAARQHARAAVRAATEPGWHAKADWLSVLVEAAAGDWPLALEKSAVFLANWPNTERRSFVRFQRAEWFSWQNDWTSAVQELVTLAAEADTLPAAAARALYLAGLAEVRLPSPDSLDRAIDLWSDAAATDETLVFPARFQQAMAKSRLGKTNEAIQQLDALVTGSLALTSPQRSAVELARGELLMQPASEAAPGLNDALTALQKVMDDPTAPWPRRARALSRRGEILARLGQREEALAALKQAAQPLIGPQPVDADLVTPSPWPARAGLAAVAVLENGRDWAAAAALAQRLAATPGAHAATARAKASRLRLEHFLWEE